MSGISPTSKPVQPLATQDVNSLLVNATHAINAQARIGWAFAPSAQDTPDMTVRLEAGAILSGVTLTEVSAQSTDTIATPTTNPRIDRVVVDRLTGVASVVTGTPAASPAAPAIPTGKVPVARVLLAVGMTAITNAAITDERQLTLLGLGGAALLEAGASVGNVPVIGSDGKLLASIIPGGSDGAVMGLMWYTWRNAGKAAGPTPSGYMWPMTSDLWTVSEAAYDPTVKGYLNGGYYSPNAATAGQAISGGDLYPKAPAFDGVDSDVNSSSTSWASSQSGAGVNGVANLGQNFGSAKNIGKLRLYQNVGIGVVTSVKVRRSSDGSTWTDVGTFAVAAGANILEFTPASAPYWHALANSSTGGYWGISELSMYPWVPLADATLTSPALTASTVPTTAKVRVQIKPTDAVTPNVDFKAWASRDGGSTWTQATLSLVWAGVDGASNQYEGEVDLSSQPSGTSVKVKVTTHNLKAQALTGAGIDL